MAKRLRNLAIEGAAILALILIALGFSLWLIYLGLTAHPAYAVPGLMTLGLNIAQLRQWIGTTRRLYAMMREEHTRNG